MSDADSSTSATTESPCKPTAQAKPVSDNAILYVAVSSKNPVKINATFQALSKTFPELEIQIVSYSVPSGVAEQPMSDHETRQGAINRCQQVAKEFQQAHGGRLPDYSIGMEGGCDIEKLYSIHGVGQNHTICFAWIAIWEPSKNRWGISRTASFALPPKVAALIEVGMELGAADDLVFGRKASGQHSGTVGYLTKGLINRTEYYEHAAILALAVFRNEEHYF